MHKLQIFLKSSHYEDERKIMCGGVHFEHKGEIFKSFFPNPKAQLPLLMRDGEITLMGWGRRKRQEGSLPVTGWARLDSIYAGRWDKYFPKPVRIPVLRYMEKDFEGRNKWYDLLPSSCIQGLVAKEGNERRVYVVTVEPDLAEQDYHDRAPRIVRMPGVVIDLARGDTL